MADDPRPIEQRRRAHVDELRRRWNSLISSNENRRREGLPPLSSLPETEMIFQWNLLNQLVIQ